MVRPRQTRVTTVLPGPVLAHWAAPADAKGEVAATVGVSRPPLTRPARAVMPAGRSRRTAPPCGCRAGRLYSVKTHAATA
jgi:hypothetical protein